MKYKLLFLEKEYYNLLELEEILKISIRTLYRYIKKYNIKKEQRGIKKEEIIRLITLYNDSIENGSISLMRPSEAAKKLGVSRSTIYRWIDEGNLSGYYLGSRTVRVSEESLIDLIKISKI